MIINLKGRMVPNFSFVEMANTENPSGPELEMETPEAAEHTYMMQELRDWYGKPMNVSSWYRTPEFNALPWVKGASNSAHLDCRASDINNIPANMYERFITAWQVICKSHNKIGGCELYSWGMHFDSHSDKFGFKSFRLVDNRR